MENSLKKEDLTDVELALFENSVRFLMQSPFNYTREKAEIEELRVAYSRRKVLNEKTD